MSFSKAVAEMEKVVESAPANKPVRWDHWSKVAAVLACLCATSYLVNQVIRKTSVVAKYKAAAANLKPRKIQNTWSPVLKQNLQKIVDASNAQKVLSCFFRMPLSMFMVSQFSCQAASDKRIAELKAVLNEINGRKGGREMTIEEVSMHVLFYVLALVSALCLCLRLASALLAHSPPFSSSGTGDVPRISKEDQPGHRRQQVVFINGALFLL